MADLPREPPAVLSFLLVLAWLGLVQAAARPFQRRRAEAREGWWRLDPGPYEWFGLAAGLIVSSILTLVSLRPETPLSQTVVAAFFDCVAITLAVGFARVEVRWNRAWVERRDVFGRCTRIGFAEIARVGIDLCGRTVLEALDGRTIPVSPYANGYAALMARVEVSEGDAPPQTRVCASRKPGAAIPR